MNSNTPNIFVRDMKQTMKFYERLGFEKKMSVPEEGDYVWVMMQLGEVSFMFQTFDSLGEDLPEISRQDGGSLLFYIKLEGIRKFHEEVKQHTELLTGLEKTFYGATEFSIKDNNGYVLTFAETES